MVLDLSNIPVEPFVEVYDNENNLIVRTCSPTTLAYIRVQIKTKSLEGYYLVTKNGARVNINKFGRIDDWPDDKLIPGDMYEEQLIKLLGN